MDDRGYTFWGNCKGTTKAGTRCKRIVVYANGYCRWHGGDSTEYMRERARQIADKSRRRTRRLLNKLGLRISNSGGQSDKKSVS